jgi:acyl-CoA synthetase (NDP forming)
MGELADERGRGVEFSGAGIHEELHRIFKPRSVAVVGVSPNQLNVNRFFLQSLREMGFGGGLYALNLKGEPVEGVPTYRRLVDIPGPVDHVIVAVPASSVWNVLQDAAAKRVRSVAVFTSGFAESGDPAGKELEERIRKWVRSQPFRLIGPNCMGIYCPESRLSFRPDFPREPGSIGYVSQSGGMTISGVLLAGARGLRFSKVVSYGNEADLSSVELLGFLAKDQATKMVWLYIEGTRFGPELGRAMKEVAACKPLVVLKGGHTPTGGRAARSHTGSMAGSWDIWRGLLRQVGGLEVRDLEEMVGTSQCLQWLGRPMGKRLGLMCVSGGLSVNYTDQAVRAGFRVPALSPSLVGRLRGILDLPGTSLENPLDLAAGFFRWPVFPEIFRCLDESGEVDLLVLVLALEYFHIPELRFPGITLQTVRTCLDAAKGLRHPLVMVVPHGLGERNREAVEEMILGARIPLFAEMGRALEAMDLWTGFWRVRG